MHVSALLRMQIYVELCKLIAAYVARCVCSKCKTTRFIRFHFHFFSLNFIASPSVAYQMTSQLDSLFTCNRCNFTPSEACKSHLMNSLAKLFLHIVFSTIWQCAFEFMTIKWTEITNQRRRRQSGVGKYTQHAL